MEFARAAGAVRLLLGVYAGNEAALGFYRAASWAPNMDVPANRAFVRDFEAAFNYVPATYAAQSFDAANLLNAAVRRVGGKAYDDRVLALGLDH